MTQQSDPQVAPEGIEQIAAECHEQWIGWMRYLFSRCTTVTSSGAYIIPNEWSLRWQRQMGTPYENLSEAEKESDRVEARKIAAILLRLPRVEGGREDYATKKKQTIAVAQYLRERAARWRASVQANSFAIIRAEECESIAHFLDSGELAAGGEVGGRLRALVAGLRQITEDDSQWSASTLPFTFMRICAKVELMDALLSAPVVSPPLWQPIETAPKDGRYLLLVETTEPSHSDLHLNPNARSATAVTVGRWCHDEWARYGVGAIKASRLSHWMPLPSSPASVSLGETRPRQKQEDQD